MRRAFLFLLFLLEIGLGTSSPVGWLDEFFQIFKTSVNKISLYSPLKTIV
uniref:Uncharacterized protein n=1 Tax=Pristhesancus plagipennis TaxID=1955184 RepID=A0A2K8JRX4_PRIPG|nr:secreted hypothetical protein [Pristhesancus plagipennis]